MISSVMGAESSNRRQKVQSSITPPWILQRCPVVSNVHHLKGSKTSLSTMQNTIKIIANVKATMSNILTETPLKSNQTPTRRQSQIPVKQKTIERKSSSRYRKRLWQQSCPPDSLTSRFILNPFCFTPTRHLGLADSCHDWNNGGTLAVKGFESTVIEEGGDTELLDHRPPKFVVAAELQPPTPRSHHHSCLPSHDS